MDIFWNYTLYIIVLIVHGCFDQMHHVTFKAMNKLFLHLMHALCFCIILINYLISFKRILLICNHDFSCAIWNKEALVNLLKDQSVLSLCAHVILLVIFEKTYSHLFIPNYT